MARASIGRRETLGGILALTIVGLLARLFALGFRVMHWDEGRVGYWILRYMESGIWEYRAILHGPFLFHVNKYVFEIFGATDFTARLIVALVGGGLPLVPWLFREHLERIEQLAASGFLALNPVLLYYSRFMRNDVLVAGFSLLAVALFVRLWDTGRTRYLYGGVFFLALAFTTKEIVLVYLAVWIGAAALLLDHRLFAARERGDRWQAEAFDYLGKIYRWGRRNWIPLVIALLEFLLVVIFMYAPRPDLYQALGNPARLPGVVQAATQGSWEKLVDLWVKGGHAHSYVAFLTDALKRTAYTSLPLAAFAVIGFVVDRYSGDRPRDVVSFSFYWGFAIFLIYPAITDISAAWSLVHPIVPLAIPAAVGIRLVVDRGLEAHAQTDWIGVALASLVILAVVGQIGVTAIETSYRSPQDESNPLVQFGQPGGYMHETLSDVERIAQEHEGGPDVRFYGKHFYIPNESVKEQFPSHPDWLNRMPLPWYLERGNANVNSTTNIQNVTGEAPVIIARAKHYAAIERRVAGYSDETYELTATDTETVFFIDRSYLNETSGPS
ncbi:MAG: flippase activity-associated protein Agl23 [Halodesulfurarchaeum sp.]